MSQLFEGASFCIRTVFDSGGDPGKGGEMALEVIRNRVVLQNSNRDVKFFVE